MTFEMMVATAIFRDRQRELEEQLRHAGSRRSEATIGKDNRRRRSSARRRFLGLGRTRANTRLQFDLH